MAVYINRVTTTIHATDSGALIEPEVLEQIVRVVLERVRREEARSTRRAKDRLDQRRRVEEG